MKLFAPPEFWDLTKEAKEEISNGCGPRSSLGFLVPDTILGLSVSPCCDIHDYMYHVGITEFHRQEADSVFLNNMVRTVLENTSYKWVMRYRLKAVGIYYKAVSEYGGPAFWDSKNKEDEFKEVKVEKVGLLKRKIDIG